MKKSVQVLFLWMFFLLGACSKDPGYHVEKYQDYKFDDVPADIHIPSEAWDLLEFKAVEEKKSEEKSGEASTKTGEKNESAKKEPAKEEGKEAIAKDLVFAEVTVYLVGKNPGVVKDEAIKISLPRGGGDIDLSQYLTDERGSFYVGFDFPEFKDSTAQKVLFLSDARKRRIDDQVYGAGCNQYFDITTKFQKAMLGQGLKVNTTRERHLSVLGGSFFFAAQKGAEVQLAQVTFRDSKHTNLFCEAR